MRLCLLWKVTIPGMYLAPEPFAMSSYKIMGTHADALEHAIAEADPV